MTERSEIQQRLADNLARVQADIYSAAASRDVTLVCVTKYAPIEHAAALIEAGAKHLGENLMPGAAERFTDLRSQGLKFQAHMLGPLQSRKATICAVTCDWYQALEREEIANRLQKALIATGKRMNVLIQVRAGDEASKHGVGPPDMPNLIEAVAGCDLLSIRGLMCIPPGPAYYPSRVAWEAGTRGIFRQMAALFARMQAGYAELLIDTLSMGMSGDYRWAIEEGATMVRIGSALFEGLR